MIYHCAVEDIFHPFIHDTHSQTAVVSRSERQSIQSVLRATSKQLKSLVLAYRMHTPSSQYFIMVANTLIHVGNDLVREPTSIVNGSTECRNEWKFFFLLCLASWQDLICKFPIAEAASKGLLTMAMRNNLLNIQEALELLNALDRPDVSTWSTGGTLQNMNFVIDFDLAVTQPEEAQLNSVTEMVSDLALFHTLTEGGDFTENNETCK